MGTIKAISLYQPWASLMADQFKRFETRSWSTLYRGLLAIHATIHFPREARELCWQEPFRGALRQSGYKTPEELPRGVIVAIGWLEGVYPTVLLVRKGRIKAMEHAFGDYSPDRFGWQVSRIHKLAQPIPARGRQGLWNWEYPPAVADIIREISDGQFTNTIS